MEAWLFLAALLAFVVQNTMGSAAISVVARLDGVAYYMHQVPEANIDLNSSNHIAEPCTVFRIPDGEQLTADLLRKEVARFGRVDDVWSQPFLANIVLSYHNNEPEIHQDVKDLFDEWRVNQTYRVPIQNGSPAPHEGPYFLHAGRLHPAYRLYPDTAGAFVVGTVPTKERFKYKAVDAAAYGEEYPTALSVPVPSRLHFVKSDKQPYAGLRIAIKDIIDLGGLKTGGSSRAYTQLHEPRNASAEAVKNLLELGFVVVGKVKTTQFADSEWPTCDWVDYHAPFNPVADGYQTTSGSSAGSAAAVATYNWLDFALGTDTLGSIRSPATAQGIYGMRSSLGAASFQGVIPYSPYFDTIGAFARDAPSFATIARAMYGSTNTPRCEKKPRKLLYPTDYWPVSHQESQKVFEAYIAKIEEYLDVKKTPINLDKSWRETNPVHSKQSLAGYLGNVFEWVANPDQWNGFLGEFLRDYEAAYGARPIINPQLQFKRDYLPTTLQPNRQSEGFILMETFRKWYEENIVPPAQEGCSDTLLVLPWSNGKPDYRDRYRESAQKFTGVGFFFYNISPYTQSPELILPAGFTSFRSQLTNKEERLPAGLGVISGRGSDVMLADLISDLETAKDSDFSRNPNQASAEQSIDHDSMPPATGIEVQKQRFFNIMERIFSCASI